MSERPRLCMVIPSLNVGGTERQVRYLVEGLTNDFAIDVVCTREPGTWSKHIQPYAEVFGLGMKSGWDHRLLFRLVRHFRSRRPDILQTFLFGFDLAANAAARRAGVPVVVSSRRERATWKKGRHVWIQKRANSMTDAIVANSSAVAAFCAEQEGRPLDTYTVIHNAVSPDADPDPLLDARVEMTVPRSAPLIGMVANFSADKDHALFVAMAERVRARRPDAHFALIGDGPLRPAIQRLAVQRGLADAFRFLGTKDALRPYYEAMDVFVLTSQTEGLPNVVLEAMAYGRPVVASAVGGIPEVISDRVTGVLVASRAPDDFAAAVLELLDHPDDAARMGRQAAVYARERFSTQVMAQAYRALYLRLLAAKRGAA